MDLVPYIYLSTKYIHDTGDAFVAELVQNIKTFGWSKSSAMVLTHASTEQKTEANNPGLSIVHKRAHCKQAINMIAEIMLVLARYITVPESMCILSLIFSFLTIPSGVEELPLKHAVCLG